MKYLLGLAGSLLLGLVLTSQSYAAVEADQIVRDTTDKVLARVQSEKDVLRADPGKMFRLVSELIFPHFDFAIMSQWVLGDHWKTADEAVRQEFVDQFRKLLVRTYATALLEFSDQEITYPEAENKGGTNTTVVRQQISQPGGSAIPITYRLHNRSGAWKVFDVSVDGVSLVKTYRASFGSMIKGGGLPGLVDSLASKNQALTD